jgi:hypothetical protein
MIYPIFTTQSDKIMSVLDVFYDCFGFMFTDITLMLTRLQAISDTPFGHTFSDKGKFLFLPPPFFMSKFVTSK